MRRNSRNKDYYHLNKRNYDNEEDDYQQNRNQNRKNPSNQRHNGGVRNSFNEQPRQSRQNQKLDKFAGDYLRSLAQPLKKAQKQKRYDYQIDMAKNQSVPVKQYIPRGGKLYLPQYEQQKKALDQDMQEYKIKAINSNSSQSQKSRKVSSNNCDDSDWVKQGQQNNFQHKKQISSLSFSVDIPPLQTKEQSMEALEPKVQQKAIQEIDKVQQINQEQTLKQEIRTKQEKLFQQEKEDNQLKNFKKIDQMQKKTFKIENLEKKIKVQDKIYNKINMKKQSKILQAFNQSYDKKTNEFQKLINAIDQFEQVQIDQVKKEEIYEKKSKEEQQKLLQKIKSNKDLITKLENSNKKAKIILTFLAISNIQSFTIKELQLKQLDFSIRLDSDGRPKIKQSLNITTDQFAKYIKFLKTSHYFPKIGQYQQQAQHYVDVAENIEFIEDQTNKIEFQFCQIKLPKDYSNLQNFHNKNVIFVTNICLLCMICGTKNQIVVLQNDGTVSCSCKGNDCSEKIYGKILQVRTEIIEQ